MAMQGGGARKVQRAWRVWSVGSLPYDSIRLVPVPLPRGGALILSRNAVLYVDHARYVVQGLGLGLGLGVRVRGQGLGAVR